jgi:SAM-dependent methyltransferase
MATIWDKKRSEWYCRAVEESNYPRKTLTALAPLLKKCESVIDIGAGCGALSLPIAQKGKQVTAVEPSWWMHALLLKRAEQAGIHNIRAYRTGWKGTRLGRGSHTKLKPHDMVICANLPHDIVSNIKFLRYIKNLSKQCIVYLQNAGGWNRFYYRDLYPLLLKRKYKNECDFINTYTFLHKQGIIANVKIFDYYLDQPFENFYEALDFWRHRMGVTLTSKKEKILAEFLKKKLIPSRRRNSLVAPFGLRRAALIWWKP